METETQTTKELKLDVLVRHDSDRGVFVAQCLQYDVAVQAPSMEKLKKRFAHTFAAYFVEHFMKGHEARQAPRVFWEMFLGGRVEESDLPIYVASTQARPIGVRANFRVTERAPTGAYL